VREIWDFEPEDEFAWFEGTTLPSDREELLVMVAERLWDTYGRMAVNQKTADQMHLGINQLIQMWCEMRRWKPLPMLWVTLNYNTINLKWSDSWKEENKVDVNAEV